MPKPSPENITGLLIAWGAGDREALDRLMPLVYQELRRLAHRQMRRERQGDTLQTTALVNEAYVRLVDYERVQARDRSHFLAIASQAMRRILIERARRKRRPKHGGDRRRVDLEEALSVAGAPADELLDLDEVLSRLETADPLAAQVVKLRYFAGLTMPEVAAALDISLRQAERNWTFARTWLHRELAEPES